MRKTDKMTDEIQRMQGDADYVILDNPLSNPKFIRKLSKGKKEIISEVYTPKIFVEIVSRLKPEHLEHLKTNENLLIELNIKDFLNEIHVNEKHGYGYLSSCIDDLQTTQLKWIEDKTEISTTVISKYTHIKGSGKISLYVDSDLAKRLLSVSNKENFSFIKHHFYKLQTSQAIKLYQFFKSWLNKGYYITELQRFKEQFGYNTNGYLMYNKFESRVLIPAITEINEKTDIDVSYKATGENLDGKRPRITGLIFTIKAKDKTKEQPEQQPKQTMQLQAPQQPEQQKQLIQQAESQQIMSIGTVPSEAEIIALGENLNLNVAEIQKVMEAFNFDPIEVWQRLKATINGIQDGTVINKTKPLGYILKSQILGTGLWQAEKNRIQKAELVKIEKQKELKIEALNKEYQDRKDVQFKRIYNDCTETEKGELLEAVKNISPNEMFLKMYIKNNMLTSLGIYAAGQIAVEELNIGKKFRQKKFREEVYNKEKITIDFDVSDKVILSNTLFEPEKPQEALTTNQPGAITAQVGSEPTNALTDAQRAENIKKYNEMKAATLQAAKLPTEHITDLQEQPEPVEQPKATQLRQTPDLEPVKQEQEPETTQTPTLEQPEPQPETEPVEPVEQSNQAPIKEKTIIGNLIAKYFS